YCPRTQRKNRSPFGRSMSSINTPISIRFGRPGRARMARIADGCGGPSVMSLSPSTGRDAAVATESTGPAHRIRVVDAAPAIFGLIEEWLAADGCTVTLEDGANGSGSGPVDLVVVDIPFPRQRGLDLLERVANDHPGTPIIALSSAFFAGVESHGAVARSLG